MSGDVERDAELFGNEERYPPHMRRPPAKVLSINQLVSYNMWRARRGMEWSQQEVAELLQMYTGRTWSNASVSAAERAWQGGRPRRFDASEIVALSRIFEQPIIYFFMPDADGNYYADTVGMREFPDGAPNIDVADKENDLMALVPTVDYVHSIGLYQATPQFIFRMQMLVSRFTHLSWEPPTWKMPFKVYDPQDFGEARQTKVQPVNDVDVAGGVELNYTIDRTELARIIGDVRERLERRLEQHSADLARSATEEVAREILNRQGPPETVGKE
jgi:transcriptional regulator with XRE-family HTH domain